jgi:hypothetical protein
MMLAPAAESHAWLRSTRACKAFSLLALEDPVLTIGSSKKEA